MNGIKPLQIFCLVSSQHSMLQVEKIWLRAHGKLESLREGPGLCPCLLYLTVTSNTDSHLNLWTPWLVVGGQGVESAAFNTVVRLGGC